VSLLLAAWVRRLGLAVRHLDPAALLRSQVPRTQRLGGGMYQKTMLAVQRPSSYLAPHAATRTSDSVSSTSNLDGVPHAKPLARTCNEPFFRSRAPVISTRLPWPNSEVGFTTSNSSI
jgi:hypothetical protein